MTNHKGFTLIELIIVIVILAVLAPAVFIAINPAKKVRQAKDAQVKSDMKQVVNALQVYSTAKTKYPGSLASLEQDLEIGRKMPKQPDGTDYSYQSDNDQRSVVWGKLYDSQGVWCWDATSGAYNNSPTAPQVNTYTCP